MHPPNALLIRCVLVRRWLLKALKLARSPNILQKSHVLYVGWSHVLAGESGIQYITFVATLGHLEDASIILGDISEGFEARWSFSGNANIQEQEF